MKILQFWKINNFFNELIFPNHPIGWDIAGTPDTVRSLVRKDFVDYRETTYHTGSMLITVSGGIEDKNIIELCNKYFGRVKNTKLTEPEKFIAKQNKPQLRLKFKKTEQAHLILGFLGNPRSYKNRWAEGLLSAMVGKGMSSRFLAR